MFQFQVTAVDGGGVARAGVMRTAHGAIETPIFMPVGTLATVKALTPEELIACGARIILGNTYHLYLRPGCDIIARFDGLHRFMNWQGPILTDSGGFQIFSLARLNQVDDDGALFQSHIDGSRHRLTPESVVGIQHTLKSDIMMCLDECTAYPAARQVVQDALERTTAWAARCKSAWQSLPQSSNSLFGSALFGIVQGGMEKDLRARSAEELCAIDFPGYAIGGLSVGEPRELMLEMAAHTLPLLPADRPRYVMGVGTPEDLIELTALGADMFDCVLPTRNARNGQLFTTTGKLNIANAIHRAADGPIDATCMCHTCRHYSRAYLRHLFTSREILAYRLLTLHNVHYFLHLMAGARRAILNRTFEAFRREFYRKLQSDPA